MVRRAVKFTPQVLLSAPRRSAGVPVLTTENGVKVLYTTSTYSFESHKKTVDLHLLESNSGEARVLAEDQAISDLNWLDDEQFVYLKPEDDGTTALLVSNAGDGNAYVAGKIDGPAGDLKLKKLHDEDDFAVVLSAQANPDGSLYNPEKAPKPHSTGRLYTKLFVRHWDRYETREKNSLWFAKLSRGKDGKYELSGLTNVLSKFGKGCLECPIRPFGGTDNFDLSADKIIFVSKDPDVNPALNTKCVIYIAHIPSWDQGKGITFSQVQVPGYDGAASYPVLSPDGTKIAFLKMKTNGYESDRNVIWLVTLPKSSEGVPSILTANSPVSKEVRTWDRSPGSLCFTPDGNSLLFVAEDRGTARVFRRDFRFTDGAPTALTSGGTVGDVQPLGGGKFFVSGSTLVDNSFYAVFDLEASDIAYNQGLWYHSLSVDGSKLGLNGKQISSIWTPASNPSINKEVHSIVVRPSDFDRTKKYPVAYLIHGGPQGSWLDSWSTRWNPAIFAEQGFIAIAVNPTGSTGYGQKFTDAISRPPNWGGDPYQDIVNVFEWVGENISEADNERAVALGASYGGYMMNWIQGHPLGRRLKAIVCHDGITSFAGGLLTTEELYFPFHDLGAPAWLLHTPTSKSNASPVAPSLLEPSTSNHHNTASSRRSPWAQWDPSNHFHAWSTPQLVIHSAKDYRLPISEGLAAFNVLQARGVESQFLTFEDENHWVLNPENSLVWHKVVLNWIRKYVGMEAFAQESEESEEFLGGLKEAAK